MAGKECDLVSKDLLSEVDIAVAGQRQDSVCLWDDAMTRRTLGLRLIADHDPHMEVQEPNAVTTDIAGFSARHIAEGRDRMCDVYVRTAPEQGFSVSYGVMDGAADDLCAGALKVAEHFARQIQG
ncbi:hypothetical protein GCM10010171_17560 [Actinokineospora fastidiosa]|uniref:Uncharacterized protein n=2 Tax=Actinokineospora fastidiosa TaxID=1816 RepID=A0A918GBF6_9PSEU|nr:hypothetical protein GCM10010171_17560 [Actinokineospora fastidiosa]